MKKNNLKSNIFKMSIIILFAIFMTTFMSNKYGYYEYKKRQSVTLTKEQIKLFEEDVKNGKEIDINDYVSNINRNYQTKLSQAGLNVSNTISKVVKTGVDNIFRYIDKVVTQ